MSASPIPGVARNALPASAIVSTIPAKPVPIVSSQAHRSSSLRVRFAKSSFAAPVNYSPHTWAIARNIAINKPNEETNDSDNHYGTLQLKQKPPASQSALLLFDHAFQGDFPRPAMRWRSAPGGSPCHLISFHLHFNVN